MRTSVVILYNTLRVITRDDDDATISDINIDLDSTGAGDNDFAITVFHDDVGDVRISYGIAYGLLPENDCDDYSS